MSIGKIKLPKTPKPGRLWRAQVKVKRLAGGWDGFGAQRSVKADGADIVGHDPAEQKILATQRAGFVAQGADHL